MFRLGIYDQDQITPFQVWGSGEPLLPWLQER